MEAERIHIDGSNAGYERCHQRGHEVRDGTDGAPVGTAA